MFNWILEALNATPHMEVTATTPAPGLAVRTLAGAAAANAMMARVIGAAIAVLATIAALGAAILTIRAAATDIPVSFQMRAT